MSSRSFSVGGYTRNIDSQEDPFNERVQATLDGTLDELPDTFENWPAERVKEAVRGIQAADASRNAKSENATSFVALHPEYLDTDENGQVLNRTLKAMFGDCVYTVEHFESAYEVARANNLMALNQVEVEKQRKAAAKARVEAERARSVGPSQEDLETMPLEDLRRLDAVENQKRMQRRGEEGGW